MSWTPEKHVQKYELLPEGDYAANVLHADISKYPDKAGNDVLEIVVVINEGEYSGRKPHVRRYLSEKAIGLIAADLVALGVDAVASDYEVPTSGEFVDAYNDATGVDVVLTVKHNADKNDPDKVYENFRLKAVS